MVTVKKVEAAHLPEVDEALAKSLGIADATVDGLRADIRQESGARSQIPFAGNRNKQAAMDALHVQGRTGSAQNPACKPNWTA
jgi:trigger factor